MENQLIEKELVKLDTLTATGISRHNPLKTAPNVPRPSSVPIDTSSCAIFHTFRRLIFSAGESEHGVLVGEHEILEWVSMEVDEHGVLGFVNMGYQDVASIGEHGIQGCMIMEC